MQLSHCLTMWTRRWSATLTIPVLVVAAVLIAQTALAATPGGPAAVVIAGSFQSELGCTDDWQSSCAATALIYDAQDAVWQGTFTLPAGSWEYKAALDGSWDENYGQNAEAGGASISLELAQATSVKFYYDHATHWVTSSQNSIIAVAPGSFQTELGCGEWGDWAPGCLRSWLQDPNGDAVYDFTTDRIPAGNYEVKVALNETWDLNYGAGGVQGGANIPFSVPDSCWSMHFQYSAASHVLTVAPAASVAQPASVTIVGSFQDELGCVNDWTPGCAGTNLVYDSEDGVWQGAFVMPYAGNYEYKAALNGSWDINYGLHAGYWGANIPLYVPQDNTLVKFYYSDATHWVTDNLSTPIYTVPGSLQVELGCAANWQPDCLRTWLQDPDGDGAYTLTSKLPEGAYGAKVAVDESWTLNYGADGVQGGSAIQFDVPENCTLTDFSLSGGTHVLTITPTSPAVIMLPAEVALSNLNQAADGSPKPVTVTTNPSGLPVNVTYDGSPSAPSAPGSYAVVAAVNHPNYEGDASGTLIIVAQPQYQSAGFTAPVDLGGIFNTARAGQTIPLKWRLLDASGNPVTDLDPAAVTMTVSPHACEIGAPTDAIETYATGTSGIVNQGDGYYQWNWKTPSSYASSCRSLHLAVGDWTDAGLSALFQFKR